MCRVLGIREPDEDTSYRLGLEFNLHVRGAHGAVFPEAAPAVRSLAARYDVHLATGNPSWLCEAQLDGMGVRDAVGILCGPDLLGTPKHSPRYYPHLFALASVDPAEVVVVDDRPGQLDLAAAAGAKTVLVSQAGRAPGSAAPVVSGLAGLPGILPTL